eukprot:3605056-Rhodomonas_salina.2
MPCTDIAYAALVSAYVPPTRCPTPRSSYAMPGTDIAYLLSPSKRPMRTELGYGATRNRRWCCAICCTELGYGTTRYAVPSQAMAVRCAGLS